MSKVDLRRETERRAKNKAARKYRRDTKLQELERQLEFAESRCGTLKQQLDYIKTMYGCASYSNFERRPSREEGHGDGADVKQFSYSDVSNSKSQTGNLANRVLKRMSCRLLETSSSSDPALFKGKELKNREKENGDGPEVIQNSVSPSNTTTTNSSNKHEKREQVKKNLCRTKKAHFKLLKVKKKSCRKIKKRRRCEDAASSKVSNASSQTQSRIWQDPVVEIYKNSAVNVESESGFDISAKNKLNKSNEILAEILRQKINNGKKQSEVGDESKTRSCNSLRTKTDANFLKEEGMQTELPFDVNQLINLAKRNEATECPNKESTQRTDAIFSENVKSYCQPTISSKRKQVERDIYSNLTNLKIRNIPFIAAKSTAPSHNIGVNIQQVLSIMKKRQPKSEYIINCTDYGNHENPVASLVSSRKMGSVTNQSETVSGTGTGVTVTSSTESKKRGEGLRTSLSHWKSNSDICREKPAICHEKPNENCNNHIYSNNWSFKVDKLKKVLVFLHEDFSSLSQKYKRLQKKLTKRNITKTDAKDELAKMERDLERKEEEITVVIALYKEVMNLREDFKKLQEKYNAIACGKTFTMEGLKQSNSMHTQMTALLRKIQNFQDKLKG